MYYYFLGKFLTAHNEKGKPIIEKMCDNSHIEVNYLTLLFAIHHARDNEIIDGINAANNVRPRHNCSSNTGQGRNQTIRERPGRTSQEYPVQEKCNRRKKESP